MIRNEIILQVRFVCENLAPYRGGKKDSWNEIIPVFQEFFFSNKSLPLLVNSTVLDFGTPILSEILNKIYVQNS